MGLAFLTHFHSVNWIPKLRHYQPACRLTRECQTNRCSRADLDAVFVGRPKLSRANEWPLTRKCGAFLCYRPRYEIAESHRASLRRRLPARATQHRLGGSRFAGALALTHLRVLANGSGSKRAPG